MAQEFTGSGARVGVVLVAVLALSALAAGLRWERTRELTAGVAIPPFGRWVGDSGLEPPPGEGCRVVLEAPRPPGELRPEWERGLRAAGWEPVGSERDGERSVYRRAGVRLLAALEPGERPNSSRLRLTFRPCPDDLRAGGDPRVVFAEP